MNKQFALGTLFGIIVFGLVKIVSGVADEVKDLIDNYFYDDDEDFTEILHQPNSPWSARNKFNDGITAVQAEASKVVKDCHGTEPVEEELPDWLQEVQKNEPVTKDEVPDDIEW